MTRKEVEDALGPVWDWYQPDDQEDRSLRDILRDVSADLQKDREVTLAAFRLVKSHENCMKIDVRPVDKVQHEINSLRSILVGLSLVLE